MINLISDTVTKPSSSMLDFMMSCEVGDDVFKSDPTVNLLQEKAASMFGMEAALFCPSGTMTNQIAIQCHIQGLEEMICDATSHVFQYETGGYAYNARAAVQLLEGKNGLITAEQVKEAVRPRYDWLPVSKLVVLENTTNKGGGSYYNLDEIRAIRRVCLDNNMALHMDGARLFNALVENGDNPRDYGEHFDTISICLSKGLGAPVGSLLLGTESTIAQARRLRKVMGGGMRQAGFIAGAGIYALDHNIERLKIDNDRARELGDVLTHMPWVEKVRPVKSNIVIFDLTDDLMADDLIERLSKKEILASAFGKRTIRFVTHLDYTASMHDRVLEELHDLM